jgi:aminomethyltransferase
MVANLGDHLRLVVNASQKAADEAHLRAQLLDACVIDPLADHALLALQGPRAEEALATLASEIGPKRFLDVRGLDLCNEPCVVSRSGYTGEDGFEISIKSEWAEALCEALLKDGLVMPAGLGARDSLRLEAGLCLYGSDLDATTTPIEAALEWSIAAARRTGGPRAGGFPGAAIVLAQIESGAGRRRVGLKPEGRAPVRSGAAIFANAAGATPIGKVSSGGYGVSLGGPIAMGYVPVALAQPGTQLLAELRGRLQAMQVSALPFVPLHYKRR